MPTRHAFIGPGRLASVLAPALAAQGECVVAIGGRDGGRAQALAARILGCRAASPEAACAAADWVWLSVPDGAIAALAAALPWRGGQVALHCSGATPLAALAPAQCVGASVAGFHPLQLFAGDEARLLGCGVGIEAAAPELRQALERLCVVLGLTAIALTAEQRSLYHAGANLAASGVLAVLAQAQAAWRAAGLNVADALSLLVPLAHGALQAGAAHGLAAAVAGPVARGDVAVLRAHLQALAVSGPEAVALYRLLARRQLELAGAAGRLSADQMAALATVLGEQS